MTHTVSDGRSLLERSSLYREWVAEREEILKHKWLESERAGRDIGFEHALVSWAVHHRALWRSAWRSCSARVTPHEPAEVDSSSKRLEV
jgi:hypothetical protein